MTGSEIGPLLAGVLAAQARQDGALRFPAISGYALSVANLARKLRADVLWPVDRGAERLAGAVEVLTRGDIPVRSWSSVAHGSRVLLVGTVGMSSVELAQVSVWARAGGAKAVHGCGFEAALECEGLDSFTVVTPDAASVARSA